MEYLRPTLQGVPIYKPPELWDDILRGDLRRSKGEKDQRADTQDGLTNAGTEGSERRVPPSSSSSVPKFISSHNPLGRVFDLGGHNTERACSIVVAINEPPKKAYPIIADYSPLPTGAILWSVGKWRIVFAEETTATGLIALGSIRLAGKQYVVKPTGISYTYLITTPFLLLKEGAIRSFLLNHQHEFNHSHPGRIFSIHPFKQSGIHTGKWTVTIDFKIPLSLKIGEYKISASPILPTKITNSPNTRG
jgi:hypothetical protein